jgi:tripartite-type tricarboxylate transporter receptor subunit TctC
MIGKIAAALLLLMGMTGLGEAQSWPAKPVRVIVPITAGSAIDIVARAVSQQMAKEFGQPFVVENRTGAGTTLGAAVVASAPPDGYTILFTSAALTTTPSTVANLSYDVARDLIAITPMVNTPLVMVTTAGKYKTLADYVAAAKAAKGAMNYATVGYGSVSHLTSEGLRLAAGFEAQAVPFRGTPDIMTEIMTDRIAFFFAPLTAAFPLVTQSKVDSLVTTSRTRSSKLPNVPTAAEAGYPNATFDFWVGLFVPAKTPPAIVDKLYREAAKIAASAEFRGQMGNIGGEPMPPMTPTQFGDYVKAELKRNAEIAKAAGLTAK